MSRIDINRKEYAHPRLKLSPTPLSCDASMSAISRLVSMGARFCSCRNLFNCSSFACRRSTVARDNTRQAELLDNHMQDLAQLAKLKEENEALKKGQDQLR